MAGRHTDLVKTDSFVPGLREEPAQELDLLDSEELTPEEILAEAPDARDIAAELAAPPRRKLPWLTLGLAGGLIAALAFAGGALVEKNNQKSGGGNNAAAAFAGFNRGGAAAGRTGGTGAAGGTAGGGGAAGGGATTGTVKLVDGSTVYLTDSSGNVVKVTTGKSTKVSVTKDGKLADLQPGQSVTVRGTTDSSGNLAATTVTEGASPFGAGGFGGFGG
ncbi:hypothetical protein ACEZCY_15095 [Streptacidiphilus sp. N1-12]|uniref:Uncharacterized protein n=2 Tax=Streptacidiphilus alkalitolerans TaxID=3342712 RepID=A0ABV6WEW5_9ACTN